MEDGLRDLNPETGKAECCDRLNPCFNGRWSASSPQAQVQEQPVAAVLILVLMEDGLRGTQTDYQE